MPASVPIQAPQLHGVARRLLMGGGAPRSIADVGAQVLVNANLAGHDSHGVQHIPFYLNSMAGGGMNPAAAPVVVEDRGAFLRVDAGQGLGHYSACRTLEWAIERARQQGLCFVLLRNHGHLGRLGEYAERAARAGCVGLIGYGTGGGGGGPGLPYGAAESRLGTNPFAAGVPTGDETPFVLDYATTVQAVSKVLLAKNRGAAMPPGVIVDRNGEPSVDPDDYFDGGNLLTFGLHKGSALSMLLCLLGGLGGDFQAEQGAMGGAWMQVYDVASFGGGAAYQQGVRAFLDSIKGAAPAPGFEEVLAPGDFEARNRGRRLVEGLEIPAPTWAELEEWGRKLAVDLQPERVDAQDHELYQ